MSEFILNAICRNCGHSHSFEFCNSVNPVRNPEIKEKIKNGELFTWRCPKCECVNLINTPFLYHDSEERLMILLTGESLRAESLPEGYTGRIVRSAGELIEKIKIFDSGLDDIVIEMCKYVTLREIGRDVSLKFISAGGPDSEMSFTYPENEEMEMIAVGFNVYEDCAGIVRRNPSIRAAAGGLCVVDADWLAKFFA